MIDVPIPQSPRKMRYPGGQTVKIGDLIWWNEGVGLLTAHERAELKWALSHAQSVVSKDARDRPFGVSVLMDMNRMEEDWHFHFVDGECGVIEAVVFPFRPNTRSEGESDS